MSRDSVTNIKNRMLKKAAQLWEVPASEIEDSFDPVIMLLLNACASEVEKLSGEIDDSHTRITERLIELMTPLHVFGTKPAHSIAFFESLEAEINITPKHQFFYKLKTDIGEVEKKEKSIFFSPTQNKKLINGRVAHMISGNKVFDLTDKKGKELRKKISKKDALDTSCLYLGISSDVDFKTINFNNVSFYFEYQGITSQSLFYHHLQNAEWYTNGKRIRVQNGYAEENVVGQIDLDAIFNGESNTMNNICRDINEFYERHYVTLKTPKNLKKTSNFQEIDELNISEDLGLSPDIFWVKIKFSTVIDSRIIDQLYCNINTFPILNRKWNQLSHSIKNFIHIIPILSDDLFLDVESIKNTLGNKYELEQTKTRTDEKGTYLIRNSNAGKLDTRKAKEYLNYLLNLLKDESAAFTFFNQEFLQKNLNSLNQNIALLDNKIREVKDNSAYTNYVYVKPYNDIENIIVEYWTSNGNLANSIKAKKPLEVYKGIDLKPKSGYLVNQVLGGDDSLNMERRLNAYRRNLLSKNRIVTKEDIKVLCYELYGEYIDKVIVQKSFMKDIALTKGLVQCVEIVLTPIKNVTLGPNEWSLLNNNCLKILDNQSSGVFPFNIIIAEN